jgi:hypothetical protein
MTHRNLSEEKKERSPEKWTAVGAKRSPTSEYDSETGQID